MHMLVAAAYNTQMLHTTHVDTIIHYYTLTLTSVTQNHGPLLVSELHQTHKTAFLF